MSEAILCRKILSISAKWYWCDPGIVRAMKRSSGPLTPEERGPLFEGLVAQILRAYRDYSSPFEDFYYWATGANSSTEVDFILQRQDDFISIEVKSGRTFAESWCKGLRVLADLKGLRRRIIVYPEGPELQTSDGIEIFPLSKFSHLLATDSLWP